MTHSLAHRGMPPAERFGHGTRARYVAGCRCESCRHSNTSAYHARMLASRAAALELHPPDAGPMRVTYVRDGRAVRRTYLRRCPGVHGEPCSAGSHLRKDSVGGLCGACRWKLTGNPLVSALEVRRHLAKLSRAGVGYKAVAVASDVGKTALARIASGRKATLRRRSALRVLAITPQALSDRALVPAKRTWQLIGLLIEEGYTLTRLARELGYKREAIQFGRQRVTARSAVAVERLYRRLTS